MQDQRQLLFVGAIAAAIILAIIAALYMAGDFVPSGVHHKHALLAAILAVGALIVANFNRPSARARL